MMQSVEELYEKWFKEELDRFRNYLADGTAQDWEDYKRVVGLIAGLEKSQTKFTELITKYRRDGE